MFYIIFVCLFIILNVICDINYLVRTVLTMLCGKIYKQKRTLHDITTIYGFGTFRDCDLRFKYVRLARLIRDLDFARYHFYDVTGIYKRSQQYDIKSLQGCTFTITMEAVPIFEPYKIATKLVFWDDRSLFLEHEVITLRDGKRRCFFVSRQHAIGRQERSTEVLLKNLSGSEKILKCPEYIKKWQESMHISSSKLR